MGHFAYLMFSFFVTGKEHNFQKNKKILHYFTIRERKNNLIYLNSQVVFGLLFLWSKYFYAKIECSGAMLILLSP